MIDLELHHASLEALLFLLRKEPQNFFCNVRNAQATAKLAMRQQQMGMCRGRRRIGKNLSEWLDADKTFEQLKQQMQERKSNKSTKFKKNEAGE